MELVLVIMINEIGNSCPVMITCTFATFGLNGQAEGKLEIILHSCTELFSL